MTIDGTVSEILGYPAWFLINDARIPAKSAPTKAAAAGGNEAQTQYDMHGNGHGKRRKIHRMQMQKQCHQPCRNGRNNNNNDRIGQPLQPGTHIQLGKVNSTCNKRKARNDKKHGTDISRLMLQGNPGNQLCDPKQNGIGNARRGNGCHNPEKQCQMMLCQFAADKVSKSCPANSISTGPPPSKNVNAPHASAAANPKATGE